MHGNVALLRTPAVRSSRGFTLLELIVVLLILGILAAIAIPTFNRIQANSVLNSVETDALAVVRNANAIAASESNGVVDQDTLIVAASEAYNFTANPDSTGLSIPQEATFGEGKNVVVPNGSVGIDITFASGSTTCVAEIRLGTGTEANKAILFDIVAGSNSSCPAYP